MTATTRNGNNTQWQQHATATTHNGKNGHGKIDNRWEE
jgi:hypothetical protein